MDGDTSLTKSSIENTEEGLVPVFSRRPFTFLIFLVFVLFSNIFTHMVRIYRASVNPLRINIVLILNTYIVEAYNIVTTVLVSIQVLYIYIYAVFFRMVL